MMNFKTEMIEKAKVAKSAEELYEIAKDNGVEMTADEVATYFAQLNPKGGELDDDDLDAVAGGAGGCGDSLPDGTIRVTSGQTCKNCGSTEGYVKTPAYCSAQVFCNKCQGAFAFFLNARMK